MIHTSTEHQADHTEDIAVTTAYIFAELMENKLFFSNIDEAVRLAKEFVQKFPPSTTHWDSEEKNWEEELFEFFCDKQNEGELNYRQT